MMDRLRFFDIERSSVNAETGEFRAVVFTDAEASDGHILSIEGAQTPERMPLFVNHAANPVTQLGSLFFERKTEHQIHYRGQIMLDGDGEQASIRRDLLAKMAAGHVSRMSGRWDAEDSDAIRRTELPEDHPAYVSAKQATKSWRLRYGYWFRKWKALEGSIVGLGADPQATMRWAEDPRTSECVRSFWRGVAEAQEFEAAPAAEERILNDDPPTDPATAPDPGSDALDNAITARDLKDFMGDLATLIHATVDARIAEARTAPATGDATDTTSEREAALLERLAALEGKLSTLEGREQGAPSPPLTPERFVRILESGLDQKTAQVLKAVEAFIAQRRGKIDEMEALRDRAVAEATEQISRSLGLSVKPKVEDAQDEPATMAQLSERLAAEFAKATERIAKRVSETA